MEQTQESGQPANRLDQLRALMSTGRLLINTKVQREAVQEVMSPLPPPWEWQRLREIAGYTATEMGGITGLHPGRIRHWERGHGTSYPALWIEYAEKLAGITPASEGRRSPEPVQPADSRAAATVESLRSLVRSLQFLTSDEIPYTAQDTEILAQSIHQASRVLRTTELRLRRYVAQCAATAGKEQDDRVA